MIRLAQPPVDGGAHLVVAVAPGRVAGHLRQVHRDQRPVRGHVGALAIDGLVGATPEPLLEDVHLGELDDGTVIEKHMGHGELNGEKFNFPTCTSYAVRDGRISAVQVHTGDQHSVDRYFWGKFQLAPIPARLAPKADPRFVRCMSNEARASRLGGSRPRRHRGRAGRSPPHGHPSGARK